MAVASAGPYDASLHLAPDRYHTSNPPLSFYRPDALLFLLDANSNNSPRFRRRLGWISIVVDVSLHWLLNAALVPWAEFAHNLRSINDSSVLYDRAYHWLLLALLDVSYSGALQISHWLIDGPWPIRKRFTGDHVWQGRSKPGCQIVGSVTIAWLTSGHRSPQPVMTCISERVAQLCCRHDDGDVCVCM